MRLQGTEALEEIRAFGAGPTDDPWKARAASVAIQLIQGETAEILAAIHAHDHDRMMWLVVAADMIGTAEAKETLLFCSVHLPDQRCRQDCASRIGGPGA